MKKKRTLQQLIDPYDLYNLDSNDSRSDIIEIEEEDDITEEIKANLNLLKERYDIPTEEVERTINDVLWGIPDER
jgi:hypothetical protein